MGVSGVKCEVGGRIVGVKYSSCLWSSTCIKCVARSYVSDISVCVFGHRFHGPLGHDRLRCRASIRRVIPRRGRRSCGII